MSLPSIDSQYLLEFLTQILSIPSPTGMTQDAITFARQALQNYSDLEISLTRKGALVATWLGKRNDAPRAITAHTDTLGAVVKEIKENGRLRLSLIGGYAWNTVEGEGCTIFTRNGKNIRGSLLLTSASGHVYGKKVSELSREEENMEVRLDIRTESPEETRAAGIEVGDFVAFDPRLEINNGFVRSRYLDDKVCVACVIAAVKSLHDAGLQPAQKVYLHISNYEEVGHGAAAGIPSDAVELIAADMAAVGEGQSSDEYNVTLCVKDSGGPYDRNLTERLRNLSEMHGIGYKIDVYPYYGSDGEAFLRSGGDVAVALVGPGVDASHNYERTHLDALVATTKLLSAYLLSD